MEAVRPITKLQQIRPLVFLIHSFYDERNNSYYYYDYYHYFICRKTAPASFIGQGKNSIPNIISLKDDSKRLNRRKGVLFTPATSVYVEL
jgi:hypothetical protein